VTTRLFAALNVFDGAHCTCNRVEKTSCIVMNKSIFHQTRQLLSRLAQTAAEIVAT
jgi:hypothetical protein